MADCLKGHGGLSIDTLSIGFMSWRSSTRVGSCPACCLNVWFANRGRLTLAPERERHLRPPRYDALDASVERDASDGPDAPPAGALRERFVYPMGDVDECPFRVGRSAVGVVPVWFFCLPSEIGKNRETTMPVTTPIHLASCSGHEHHMTSSSA